MHQRPTSLQKLVSLYSRRERLGAVVLLFLMLIGALLEVAGIGALPAFVALLSEPARATRFAISRQAFDLLNATTTEQRVLWAAFGLVVLFAVKNGYIAAFTYLQARYAYNRQVSLANRLLNLYLRAPYTFHLERNSAQLLHHANNESFRVVDDVLFPALRLVMELFVLASVLSLVIAIEPIVSVVMVVLLGGASLLFFRTIRLKTTTFGEAQHICRSRMIQAVNQGLGGIKDVKVLGREAYFLRAFAESAWGYTRAGRYKSVIFELPRLMLEVVSVFAMFVVAAVFIGKGRPIQTIVPMLTLLALVALRLIPSANRITNAVIAFRWGKPALDAIYADVQLLQAVVGIESDSTDYRSDFQHEIEFADVSYRYPGAATESLRGINLKIRKGKSVGLVGPSGAGKTTAVDVLLGLLEPVSGRVLVDGKNIWEDIAAWRRQIGYIPQQVYLSDDSIRRNIAFGVPDEEIDTPSVMAAVEAAQLTELVDSLPNGLDTVVGEDGTRLSGGQRQRVGIARALYHNPPVLVMDEATSALDHETEQDVVRALDHLRGTRTMIIIAHRLTTVAKCDELVVLKNGELAARGKYDDLQYVHRATAVSA